MKFKKITAIVGALALSGLLLAGCAAEANTSPGAAGAEVPKVEATAAPAETSTAPSKATQASPEPTVTAAQTPSETPAAQPTETAQEATPAPTSTPDPSETTQLEPQVVPAAFEAAAATPQPTVPALNTAPVRIDLTGIADRVQALSNKMDTANITDYKTLKKEGKQLESEIDRAEDQAKLAYFNATISREDFDRLDMQLDILDDLLDNAEDIMEARLGISD